jgi:F-type H+/Na+-transporting ATPase subunit alpha
MQVQEQVASIFAGISGFLDDVPLAEVARFEKEYLEHLQTRHPDIIPEIADQKKLSDELQEKMKSILRDFSQSFMLSINSNG